MEVLKTGKNIEGGVAMENWNTHKLLVTGSNPVAATIFPSCFPSYGETMSKLSKYPKESLKSSVWMVFDKDSR